MSGSVAAGAVGPEDRSGPVGLDGLARLHGVEVSYRDVDGVEQSADPDTVMAVLRALGVGIDDPADAHRWIRDERRRRHRQVLEPVVGAVGPGASVPVVIPDGRDLRRATLWITDEDGRTEPRSLSSVVGPPVGASQEDGVRAHHFAVPVAALGLGPGYHRLILDGGGLEGSTLLVVAPPCPLPRPGWGGFLPVPALRTADDWGIGTYRALGQLGAWLEARGADFVGTLPLYAAVHAGGVEPSPYLPVSRLAWNELFVDPTAVPEWESVSGTERDRLVAAGRAAHRADLVDYPSVLATVGGALAAMARTLEVTASSRRNRFEEFARSRHDLVALARYRAALEAGVGPGRPDHGPTSGPADRTSVLDQLDEAARTHLYAQWVADEQLAHAGGRLYLDLPVGVHPDGFDPWWEDGAFVAGMEGGAPPDAFNVAGQRWGFRPLHPEQVRQDGYRYPIACLRHVMAHASVLRIDHVMGMHRLWWVPEGADARHGVYVRYRLEEMQAVIALEAHRSGTAVVGEDLGTVPSEVREAMDQSRMLRSWVLQFEVSEEDPLPDPPESVMASIGTHDLPRFASFWSGRDLDELEASGAQSSAWSARQRTGRDGWRRALTATAAETVTGDPQMGRASDPDALRQAGLLACLDHLADSRARLVTVDLEDLWGERQPVNRPGTGSDVPNWRRRASRALEEIVADPSLTETLAHLDDARRRAGAAGLATTPGGGR